MQEKNKVNHVNLFPSTSTENLFNSNQSNYDKKLITANKNSFNDNDTKNNNLKQFFNNENKIQKSYLNNNKNVVFRSMNNTPVMEAKFSTPLVSSSFSKIYSAIPFKNVNNKNGLNKAISNAVSTPSLLTAENNLFQHQQQQQPKFNENITINKDNNLKKNMSENETLNYFGQEMSEIDNNLIEKKRSGYIFFNLIIF